jgi:hypothetical protein
MQLDAHTFYSIENENIIVTMSSIRESNDFNTTVDKYTESDLIQYHSINKNENITLDMGKNDRCVILDNKNNILFIPLYNKYKNIVDYTYTDIKYLSLLKTHNIYRKINRNKKYAISSANQKYIHLVIFGEKEDNNNVIDHINGNSLDNRINNLREVTVAQNSANRKNPCDRFKGVGWHVYRKKWQSSLYYNKKKLYLGLFDNEIDAAKIHDVYYVHYFRNTKNINNIKGINLLSDEDIQTILNKGIPEIYTISKKKPIKNLPINISENKKQTGYVYSKRFYKSFINMECAKYILNDFQRIFPEINSLKNTDIEKDEIFYVIRVLLKKTYKTLDETIYSLEKLNNYIREIDSKINFYMQNNICRNKLGVAILYANDTTSKTYVEVEVDDEDWIEYFKYPWYINNGGYPCCSGLQFSTLHLNIFYRHYKEMYDNKNNKDTIDHMDRNKRNAKKNNLRIANPSQQSQNQNNYSKFQYDTYTGVFLNRGKFYAKCSKKNIKFKSKGYIYLEDAAIKYNEFALIFDKNARINIVPNTKTKIEDIYSKKNITDTFIKNIKNTQEIKEILRLNRDWKNMMNIQRIDDIKIDDLNIYKNMLLNIVSPQVITRKRVILNIVN